MIDPYEIVGVERGAETATVKSAYRRRAKSLHPDGGGDVEAFDRLKTAYELLLDPIRRKVYDDTGYDPALADASDRKGLLVLETLVNDVLLDEREPGSYDPVAAMRRKLSDEIVSARFHILEMERHRSRVRNHMDRIGRRSGADVLGSMLRSRCDSIGEAITKAEGQIEAIEKAYAMLEGYSYAIETDIRNAAE